MAVNYYFHGGASGGGPGAKVDDWTGRRAGVDHFDTRGQTSFANYTWSKGDKSYRGQDRGRVGGANLQFPWQDARRSPYWGKYEEYVLPSGRNWMTTWKASRKQDNWNDERSGASPQAMGWQKGIHYTTGQERSRYHVSGKRAYDSGYNLIEVLDYNAYNKAPEYQRAAKDYGLKGKIDSLADLLAVEEYMSTGITKAKQQEQAAADKRLQQTKDAIRLNQQKIDKIEHIDIGGKSIPIKNIGSYLTSQLSQQQTAHSAALSSMQGAHQKAIANQAAAHNTALNTLRTTNQAAIDKLTGKLTAAEAAASYGYGFQDPVVQGVKTINELQPSTKGVRQSFNRGGKRIMQTVSSLNI